MFFSKFQKLRKKFLVPVFMSFNLMTRYMTTIFLGKFDLLCTYAIIDVIDDRLNVQILKKTEDVVELIIFYCFLKVENLLFLNSFSCFGFKSFGFYFTEKRLRLSIRKTILLTRVMYAVGTLIQLYPEFNLSQIYLTRYACETNSSYFNA